MDNVIKVGNIGPDGMMAEMFQAQLETKDPTQPLYIDIHSQGGLVLEGFAIGLALSEWTGPTVARVKVAALSIASYIAMACDEIEIASNGYFMIHNPYTETSGDDEAHAKGQKLLGELKESMINTYSAKSGLPVDEVKGLMKAETFISASEAISLGMADRLIDASVAPVVYPKNQTPTLVYAAMYGRQSDGDPPAETPKETPMSKTEPVAATVKTIKAAYPKATSEFIVKCMEDDMAMEDVGEEYAKAMEEENQELKSKLAAMEEEIVALKASAESEEEPEEEMPVPAASGAAPVANAGESTSGDAKAEFESLVEANVSKGMSRVKAVIAANRAKPMLRQAMVAQANGQMV